MTASVLVSIGLILDIAGVVLLFIYGLPHPSEFAGVLNWGSAEKQEKVKRRVRARSRLGLALLVTGFALQLVGNLISATAVCASGCSGTPVYLSCNDAPPRNRIGSDPLDSPVWMGHSHSRHPLAYRRSPVGPQGLSFFPSAIF